MAKILFGEDFLEKNTVITSLINANSPMVWDGTMLGAMKVYARANQACITTPFILAGAMSPVTAAGTLAQVLAEVLAGAGTCAALSAGRAGDLRRVRQLDLDAIGRADLRHAGADPGLPSRAASWRGASASRTAPAARSAPRRSADAQAAYESAQTLLPTLLAGTNFVLHGAGWLEGGLASGYEKFVMDADQLGMMQVLAKGVDLSENGQALDAIREVGPGSHFLGCAHTQANFETAFYRSTIADNNSYEQWRSRRRARTPPSAPTSSRRRC